jgi:hypothetical protein
MYISIIAFVQKKIPSLREMINLVKWTGFRTSTFIPNEDAGERMG